MAVEVQSLLKGRQFMYAGSIRAEFLVPLLLCAAGALGQSAVSNSYDINLNNAVTVNSCSNGEPVALDGTVHIDVSASTDSAGGSHFTIAAADSLTGSGQTTGTAYTASDSDNYVSNNDEPSTDLTVELKSDLKSQGSTPGLTLVQSLHIVVDTTGNISAQVVSNSTSCGN
jgi:hypothetical protein